MAISEATPFCSPAIEITYLWKYDEREYGSDPVSHFEDLDFIRLLLLLRPGYTADGKGHKAEALSARKGLRGAVVNRRDDVPPGKHTKLPRNEKFSFQLLAP